MNRFKNVLNDFSGRMISICRQSFVELWIAVFMAVCTVLLYKRVWDITGYPMLLPIFFTVTYVLNRISRKRIFRWLYYCSAFFPFPFLAVDVSDWVFSSGYVVAIAVCFCTLFVYTWIKDNVGFVVRALELLNDICASFLINGVAFLLLLGIYYSVTYIFSLHRNYESDIITYLSIFVFMITWPSVFLLMNDRNPDSEVSERESTALFSNLINFVFTPALLVYTVILYLYFFMILIQWSLPKGGIAICVFSFILIAAGVKACLLLLKKQNALSFYRSFSYIALPALGMFWGGVWFRIAQYGFTESRLYLTVCGVIMTIYVLMFMNRRWGRYLYVTLIGALLLAFFTYIPGYTARDLGIRSQKVRMDRVIDDLQLRNNNGFIRQDRLPESTIDRKEELKQLYESFVYVWRETGDRYMSDHYGISTPHDLKRKVFPVSVNRYMDSDTLVEESIRLERDSNMLDISGFSTMIFYSFYDVMEDEKIVLKTSDNTVLYQDSLQTVLNVLLDKIGLLSKDSISERDLLDHSEELMIYDTDSLRIVFKTLFIQKRETSWAIENYSVDCVLLR